jgi:flavin reductase (DIM6/NTAB) family NADH-FMN oxidoreductase RutF
MGIGPDEYKEALARFTSGVTVVTVGSEAGVHGMTASSFASVSLHPPLVLVSLEKLSRTHDLVLERGAFAVNILESSQRDIARAFSKRGVKPFDRLPYRLGSAGAPLLDGALAHLECRTVDVVDGGDHDLFIAEVIATEVHEGSPLVYYRREYRALDGL